MATAATHLEWLDSQTVLSRSGGEASSRFKIREILLPLALFFVLVMQIWVRITFIEEGYKLEELRKTALANDALLREKRHELALLSRPSFLISLAHERLGMIETRPQQIRTLPLAPGNR